MQAIFIYIPQLSGMSYDEMIRREDLHQVLSIFNPDLLRQFQPSAPSREKYTNLEDSYFHLKPPIGKQLSFLFPQNLQVAQLMLMK
jgi:hypothetical protein